MIKLREVTAECQKRLVRKIIRKYHSYVPTTDSVGRRIDWLIYDVEDDTVYPPKEELVGMIGIGSSVYPPPKDLINYVGMTMKQYKDCFNTFANNWRYCNIVKIKNGGTQTLRQLRQLAPIAWRKKYGDKLQYLITFVAGGNNGAVYKADNWTMVGETAGLPKHESSSMKWTHTDDLKELFVKPTGENKKLIFVKKLDTEKIVWPDGPLTKKPQSIKSPKKKKAKPQILVDFF